MTDPDLVLIADRVLTDAAVRPAAVVISDGRIVAIESPERAPRAGRRVELATDEVLIPGLVDTHVHVNEPGRTEWEGFASATRAAAAGGVTTILDMPLNCIPATVSPGALAVKREVAQGQCFVDVGYWGGAVPDSLGRLRELHDAGAFGMKCFLLDSGVPEFPPLNPDQLRRAMTEIAAFDGLLIVHAEDPATIAEHTVAHAPHYSDFLTSRPPEAENRAIQTVLATARATGCRVHIVHLSSAQALPALAAARADGVRVSVETCPHYLTLDAADIPDGATQYKCCPPVRDAGNADRLWQALADGTIDFIVSDHSPSTPEQKFAGDGDFAVAWGGIASVQLGLPLIWSEAHRRGHDLAAVLRWMAGGPAGLIGVPERGAIAVGNHADLVVFAPDEQFTVDAAALHHRHAVSPYDGRTLSGGVRRTYLHGTQIDLAGPPRGRSIGPAGR